MSYLVRHLNDFWITKFRKKFTIIEDYRFFSLKIKF